MITQGDWKELAAVSKGGDEVEGLMDGGRVRMGRLFDRRWDEAGCEEERKGRQRGVFYGLEREAYEKTRGIVVGEGRVMKFRGIEPLLCVNEAETRAMKKVMMHVLSWVGEKPVLMGNSRQPEKAALREGLRVHMTGVGRKRGFMGEGEARGWAEDMSILVERLVVEGVWAHRAGVKDGDYEEEIKTYPDDDYEKYGVRFRRKGWWRTILAGVERLLPGEGKFPFPWDRGAEEGAGRSEDIVEGIVGCVTGYAEQCAEVREDAALVGWESREALKAMIRKTARGWIRERREQYEAERRTG